MIYCINCSNSWDNELLLVDLEGDDVDVIGENIVGAQWSIFISVVRKWQVSSIQNRKCSFNNKRWSSKYDVDEGGETILYSIRKVEKLSSIGTNSAKKVTFQLQKLTKDLWLKCSKICHINICNLLTHFCDFLSFWEETGIGYNLPNDHCDRRVDASVTAL